MTRSVPPLSHYLAARHQGGHGPGQHVDRHRNGHAGRARHVDAGDHPSDPRVAGAGGRLLSTRRGRAPQAPAPTFSTRATSLRWHRPLTWGGYAGRRRRYAATRAVRRADEDGRRRFRADRKGPTPAEEVDDAGSPRRDAPEPATASERKAINDAVAYIRSLAEQRGRNAEWAERAVRSGESLSAQAALAAGVIDVIANDLDDLLTKLDGRRVNVNGAEHTLAPTGSFPSASSPTGAHTFSQSSPTRPSRIC